MGTDTARGRRGIIGVWLTNRLPRRLAARPKNLRETAVDLMEHAALLIEKSVDLERRILAPDTPKTTKKS